MFLNLGSGPRRLMHLQHIQLMEEYAPFNKWTLVDLYADKEDFDTYTPTKELNKQIKTWDATKLYEVEDNSCDVIYSSHLLEHFPHTETLEIVKMWTRKLKSGGKLILNVPDLLWACREIEKYEKGHLLNGYYNTFAGEHGLLSVVYGSESHEGEYHKAGFTKTYLTNLLSSCDLRGIEIQVMVDAHDMGVLIAKGAKFVEGEKLYV